MKSNMKYLSLLAALIAQSSLVSAASSCQSGFTLCQPSGATTTTLPGTGPELAPLYNDLLGSVKGVPPPTKRDGDSLGELEELKELKERDTPSTCCNSDLTCLNLVGFNVPMCYDRFTTNFRLADGSTGTIDDGSFTGADQGTANLRNGSYIASNGAAGNMYAGGGAASNSPTDTAAIPTPYTAAGLGSAIPISALGAYATFIVTVPATTIPGTTVAAETTTFAGQTAATTVAGTTRVDTTIAAHTTLVTSAIQGVATAQSSTKTGAAGAPMPTAHVAGLVGAAAVAFLL